MPRNEEILTVFVASPSDVSEERDLLENTIDEINRMHARHVGVRLELLRWEHDVSPDFGDDPQEVVNKQIPQDYDVFVGIFWNRIGSPTSRAASGTLEEYRLAKDRYDEDPNSVRLMLYFKSSPPLSMDGFDPDQYKHVLEFRQQVSEEGGLYREFATSDDFANRVRVDLVGVVSGRTKKGPDVETCESEVGQGSDSAEAVGAEDHLPSEELDDGLLELEERFEEEMGAMNAVLGRMGKALEDVGSRVECRTRALREIRIPEDRTQLREPERRNLRAQAKRILKQAAGDLGTFVGRTKPELALLRQHLDRGMEAFSSAIPIYLELNSDHGELKSSGDAMLEAMDKALEGIGGFHESIQALPRMTTSLARSKRETEKVLQELLEVLRGGRSSLSAALVLLP